MERKHDIYLVRECVAAGCYEFYRHALTEARKDGVILADVIYVLLNGKVIEEYPERARLLVYGEMPNGLPLHVVCDLLDEDVMYIPTVTFPQAKLGFGFKFARDNQRNANERP